MDLQHAAAVLETSREVLMDGERKDSGFGMPMPHNALDGFGNGAILDLRVRFAMDLLTHSPSVAGGADSPHAADVARYALDLSCELLRLAEHRGFVKPLGEVDDHLLAHIRRQVVYQVETQKEQVRQAEQNGRIAKAVRGAFPRN